MVGNRIPEAKVLKTAVIEELQIMVNVDKDRGSPEYEAFGTQKWK